MRLEQLTAGMTIPWGGDRLATVDETLANAFQPGDRLIVVQDDGALLHVPGRIAARVDLAVTRARSAFTQMTRADDAAVARFFEAFAARLADDGVWRKIARANRDDLERARAAGRATTRLEAQDSMRADMIAGLRAWRDASSAAGRLIEQVAHDGWSVEIETAPLGVVGFVFEGRPNVLVDAAGVLRGGNTAVLRIGADALATARAIADAALRPALEAAGLPEAAITLLDVADRSAGWALFSDSRLALMVARGSGPAVRQLGAVARQAGVPASLHGTGGAWLVADEAADAARFAAVVARSLDRKVCNTLNVCCIVRSRAAELAPLFAQTLWDVGQALGHGARLHAADRDLAWLGGKWGGRRASGSDGAGDDAFVIGHGEPDLGREWEWDAAPEVWLAVVDDLDEAIRRFNAESPRFIASLVSEDPLAQQRFWAGVEAAFVGDGFTRWVDGQYALGRPELGLSNWRNGRLLARSGFLVGDGVFSLRARMRQTDPTLTR